MRTVGSSASGGGLATSEEPVEGAAVNFEVISPTGGVVGKLNATTLADGIASVSMTLGSLDGQYQIIATCGICVANNQVTFSATALTVEQATELRKISCDDTGSINELLRNSLHVRAVNRITGDGVPGLDVLFSFLPSAPCPNGTGIESPNGQTDPNGLVRTRIQLGGTTGSCAVRARCNNCLSNQEVTCSVGIGPPRELPLDNGTPGNPITRAGGGPSPAGAKRSDKPFDIEYTLPTLTPGTFRLTRPPSGGFIGVLKDDEVRYRAVPSSPGTFVWTGTLGLGDGIGTSINVFFNQFIAGVADPATQTLTHDSDPPVSVKILIAERPTEVIEKVKMAEIAILCELSFSSALCVRLFLLHGEAISWAKKSFLPRGRGGSCWNDCCDAGKHMYWHALATQESNSSLAKLLGDAHEGDNLRVGGGHNEIVMDLHNNNLGRIIGDTAPDDATAATFVLNEIREGNALVLFEYSNNDKLSMLVPSSRCRE